MFLSVALCFFTALASLEIGIKLPSYIIHLSVVSTLSSYITMIQIVHLKCSEEIATYVKKNWN